MQTTFAYIFIVLSLAVAVFQVALVLGAPLGELTLGGKFPGRLPGKIRILAMVQFVIILFFASIVASRAGLAFAGMANFSRIGGWVVFGFFILGSLANLSSPSKKEQMIMGPLNIVALISSLVVALG